MKNIILFTKKYNEIIEYINEQFHIKLNTTSNDTDHDENVIQNQHTLSSKQDSHNPSIIYEQSPHDDEQEIIMSRLRKMGDEPTKSSLLQKHTEISSLPPNSISQHDLDAVSALRMLKVSGEEEGEKNNNSKHSSSQETNCTLPASPEQSTHCNHPIVTPSKKINTKIYLDI